MIQLQKRLFILCKHIHKPFVQRLIALLVSGLIALLLSGTFLLAKYGTFGTDLTQGSVSAITHRVVLVTLR